MSQINFNLSNREKKEIKKMFKKEPGFFKQGNLGLFFDKFLLIEALMRKLINYYKTQNNKKINDTQYQITEIKAVFRKLGTISKYEKNIDIIFPGGSGTRDNKSARQLRNGYIHSLSDKDKNEILMNCDSFINQINKLIQYFKNISD